MIFAHGIYSWVEEETRHFLDAFFGTSIEKAGLLYLSYNSLPCWDSLSFIRKEFANSLKENPGEPEKAAVIALERLISLRDAGALVFHHNKAAIGFLNYLVEMGNIQYAVHEFYGESNKAFWIADLYEILSQHGFTFAADAALLENRDAHEGSPGSIELIEKCSSEQDRQTIKNLLQNRLFRNDIFTFGQDASTREHLASHALDWVRLGIYGLAPKLPASVRKKTGQEVDLDPALITRLDSNYRNRTFTVRDLVNDGQIDLDFNQISREVMLLIAEEYVAPFAGEFVPVSSRGLNDIKIPLFNRCLLEHPEEDRGMIFVASPATGSGISVSPGDALMLRAHEHGNPSEWLLNNACKIAENHAIFEKSVQENFSSRAEIDDCIEDFRPRLNQYLALGVVTTEDG